MLLNEDRAELMLNYFLENKEHLSKWEPQRESTFYTIENWEKILQESCSMFDSGSVIKFSALNKEQTKVIGLCSFTNIVHGVFQACNLSYSISKKYEGKGYMSEIVEAAIGYIFEVVGLHRIMANHLPENEKSASVLHRQGFEREGYAKSYLKINGQWRDHVLTSKVNPNSGT